MDLSPLHFHKKIALQYSGGKDSLACLELVKDHLEKITVVWMNTGAAYPETIAHMEEVKKSVPHFLEITSNQEQHIRAFGYPIDFEPLKSTLIPLQSWSTCCSANMWVPTQNGIRENKFTLVIRGQKKRDARQARIASGHVDQFGIEYLFPLEDWTDDDVFSFLGKRGIAIPTFYQWAGTSLDCWNCTAYLDERERELRNMRFHHPGKWQEVKRRFIQIKKAIDDESNFLASIIQ